MASVIRSVFVAAPGALCGFARLTTFWPMPPCLPIRRQRISTPRETNTETSQETLKETTMATHKLLLLPGDGIGPEVMAEVKRLIDWLNAKGVASFETEQGLVGGSAYDAHKVSITDDTMAMAKSADAII